MQAYAIYTSLRAQLGQHGSSLKEVQATKSGFALCPSTPEALPTLETQKESISTFFGGCPVERSSRWVSYRLINVPRSIGQLMQGQYTLVPLDSKTLATEISEATGIQPVSVSETTSSRSNNYSASSSWFVNFAEGTEVTLPRQLRLFGTVTNPQLLSKRTKVIQCNRCWKWHNPRSCARPLRCRLCGSTEHTEEGHTNNCSTPNPHCCPPRCFHCHGPHPADSPECLLRPRDGITRTKAQQAEIRKSCAMNLAKARTEQGCCSVPPTDSQEQPMVIDIASTQAQVIFPFRTTTPPPQTPSEEPPVTAQAVRFTTPKPQNRFTSLLEEQI
jgi:hypothetical protein